MLQAAVERQFEIIGEAGNRLAQLHPELASRLPELPRMVAFRNIFIHGYSTIDPVIVWGVVEHDIGPLEALLEEHLI